MQLQRRIFIGQLVAIKRIQEAVRDFLNRKCKLELARENRFTVETRACVMIQSCWRGFIQRRIYCATVGAATTIQAFCRGFLSRKRQRECHIAARKIQVIFYF